MCPHKGVSHEGEEDDEFPPPFNSLVSTVISRQARRWCFLLLLLLPALRILCQDAPQSSVTVSISQPITGSVFLQGDAIPISPVFSSSSVSFARVICYTDDMEICRSETAPYLMQWTSAPLGTHTLTVAAEDLDGNTITSEPVAISVTTPIEIDSTPQIQTTQTPTTSTGDTVLGPFQNNVQTIPDLPDESPIPDSRLQVLEHQSDLGACCQELPSQDVAKNASPSSFVYYCPDLDNVSQEIAYNMILPNNLTPMYTTCDTKYDGNIVSQFLWSNNPETIIQPNLCLAYMHVNDAYTFAVSYHHTNATGRRIVIRIVLLNETPANCIVNSIVHTEGKDRNAGIAGSKCAVN